MLWNQSIRQILKGKLYACMCKQRNRNHINECVPPVKVNSFGILPNWYQIYDDCTCMGIGFRLCTLLHKHTPHIECRRSITECILYVFSLCETAWNGILSRSQSFCFQFSAYRVFFPLFFLCFLFPLYIRKYIFSHHLNLGSPKRILTFVFFLCVFQSAQCSP